MSLSEDAATLRIELELGVIARREVAAWANDMIVTLDEVPQSLLDLSNAGESNPHDVRSLLNKLAADASIFEALRKALGRMNEELIHHPKLGPIFARGLYQIAAEVQYKLPEDLRLIVGFDDEYALAKQGVYGTEDSVRHALLEFTSRFRDGAV